MLNDDWAWIYNNRTKLFTTKLNSILLRKLNKKMLGKGKNRKQNSKWSSQRPSASMLVKMK